MDIPITKKVHDRKSAPKSPVCPSCGVPIAQSSSCCSSKYIHVRGGK